MAAASTTRRRLAAPLADRVITGASRRAAQMNAGARYASGDVLLFLHADTRLPEGADSLLAKALADERWLWGRFDVVIEGAHPLLRIVAWFDESPFASHRDCDRRPGHVRAPGGLRKGRRLP